MSKRVLVTGSSGYLGRVLVEALLKHPLVSRVVGVDLAPAGLADPKFKPRPADIRDEFLMRSILEEEAVDTIYHLAFVMGEPRDEIRARAVNVGGTLNVLEAANKSSTVKRLIISGSASAYGARADNPEFLREEDPLRADTLSYGIHKRMVEEELAKALPAVRKSLQTVILRICTIVGASPRGAGPVATFCRLPLGVSVLFRKGGLQFIGEDELMRVMLRVMEAADMRGAFNVAPDDRTTLAELCKAMGKPRLPAPYSALWLALYLLRRIGGKTDVTEKVVSYLAYPAVLSNAKIKKALGIRFQKGSLESFLQRAKTMRP